MVRIRSEYNRLCINQSYSVHACLGVMYFKLVATDIAFQGL